MNSDTIIGTVIAVLIAVYMTAAVVWIVYRICHDYKYDSSLSDDV